jgi:hypothetical protein
MPVPAIRIVPILAALALAAASASQAAPVILGASNNNVVATWNEIAAATLNADVPTATTPEERRPLTYGDMTSVALAMYDAICAIDGRYQPYAIVPRITAEGASIEAAASTAAVGVLRAIYPNRSAHYQPAYEKYIASLPAGLARDRGVALGLDVAAGIVAKRANDGRGAVLPDYVPGTQPGKFRGNKPMLRDGSALLPFTLTRADQFRPPPPPATDSAEYTAAFNETKAMGGKASSKRSAAQLAVAQFHTEPPFTFLPRNFGRLARSTTDPAEAARLLAAAYAVQADAIIACFDAKYHYNAWRPNSAITLADTDNNPATIGDSGWTSAAPTPNHPEYPAAHSCTAGALAAMLRHIYGTDQVSFSWDSTATGTTHNYKDLAAFRAESTAARIWGGMHFRFSTETGEKLGQQVGAAAMQGRFGLKK